MPEISPLIRLFVSSTFSDFTFEREVLQRAVFPRLRTLCAAQGCRFQPIDLRWGVSEEAGNEKRTLAICLDEIARCQRLSPDLNFLILLGDRYGSCILPERIPSDQVARLLPNLALAERDAFAQAYKEDLNALRPEYVLLPSERAMDARQLEEPLRAALAQAAQAAGFTEQKLLPFVASATHLEIQRGLLDAGSDPSAALCAIRSLESMPEESRAAQYVEQDPGRRMQLKALTAAVEQRLGGRVWRYGAPGRIVGPRMGRAARALYKSLSEQFYALLEPRIKDALALRQVAAQTRDPSAEANRQFAESRASVVIGRNDALDTISAYVVGEARVPLVVTGELGVGKSTVIARAAENAAHNNPNSVLVTRFIGVTPGTSSLYDLLSGLQREIAIRYDLPMPEPIRELPQLVGAVANQLRTLRASNERPLYLFLDAVDQLSAQSQRIDWIPRVLAPHVRIILSIPSDRQERDDLLAWQPATQIVQLTPLTREQGADVLRSYLGVEGRQLTAEQESAILDGFATKQDGAGVPLYLRLAMNQARTWHSFDTVHALPSSVSALIRAFFLELEKPERHGATIVACALGDIAAARHGLTEVELLDLLAQNAHVREAHRQLSPGSPPIKAQRPLPMALWARLAADVDSYMTEREADGANLLTFYHRQIGEVANDRYLAGSEQAARHADLAAYFNQQPFNFADGSSQGRWNQRKLAEIAYQQMGSGLATLHALETTLTDGRFLEGKLSVEGVSSTLIDLAFISTNEDIINIANAVRAGSVVLTKDPGELLNQVIGRIGLVQSLHNVPPKTASWLRLRTKSLEHDPGISLLMQGHTDEITSCALSEDGRRALSASKDKTLRLWDTSTGQCLTVLKGHAKSVTDCALSGDGLRALSVSEDGDFRYWDTASGQAIYRGKGHPHGETTCALSVSGHRALTASSRSSDPTNREDFKIRLWDMTKGTIIRSLIGHTGAITACGMSGNGLRAISASTDATLRVWDTESGRQTHILRVGDRKVLGCAISADARRAISISVGSPSAAHPLQPTTWLQVWDIEKGRLLHNLSNGSNSTVWTSCTLSPDGQIAAATASEVVSNGFKSISKHASNASTFASGAIVHMWSVEAGKSTTIIEGRRPMVTSCSVSQTGMLLFPIDNGVLELRSSGSIDSAVAQGHKSQITHCTLSANGSKALTSSQDGIVQLWDTAAGSIQCVLQSHKGIVWSCALTAIGDRAMTASSDQKVRIWDTIAGKTLHELRTAGRMGSTCAMSADASRAISASLDAKLVFPWASDLRIWNFQNGKKLRSLRNFNGDVVLVSAMSADGRLALCRMEDAFTFRSILRGIKDRHLEFELKSAVGVWDIAAGRILFILIERGEPVGPCALNSNGRIAIAVTDHNVKVWNVATRQQLSYPLTHRASMNTLVLSEDGHLAMSTYNDQTVRLWNVTTGQELARWTHDVELEACALDAAGKLAVTGDANGGVHFLELVSGSHKETVLA